MLTKVCLVKAMVFPVVMYRYKSWTLKKAEHQKIDTFEKQKCFWTVVLEKTLESPLYCKEIQSVHPNGNWFWIVIGRTNVEAETPIFWPHVAKSWLIGKDSDAAKDWGREDNRTTEDEMVGWHHRLNGRWVWVNSGIGDRQGGLAGCSSWGHKESEATEWLNWF